MTVTSDGRVFVEQRTWDAWDAERGERAKVARAKTAGPSHIDVFLKGLRAWKDGAYSACPDPQRWTADCPACGCDRAVTIIESGRGQVGIWCRTGCSERVIVDAGAAWRNAQAARDAALDEAYGLITYLEERVNLLEAVADRLCDHIASGGV